MIVDHMVTRLVDGSVIYNLTCVVLRLYAQQWDIISDVRSVDCISIVLFRGQMTIVRTDTHGRLI